MSMAVRKMGASWRVDITWRRKRYRICSPLNTKSGAEAYEAVLRQKLARGESIGALVEEDAPKKTFREFATSWLEVYVKTNNKPSEQRAKSYILSRHLMPSFGKLLVGDIDSLAIEQYKAARMRDGLSPKTINNHLTALRRCLQCAFDWGEIDVVPRVQWLKRPPGRIDYLTDEECARLMSDNHDPQWNLMVKTALFTGMRVGELLALEWGDIDMSRRTLTVRRSAFRGVTGSPKSNRTRCIPIMSDLAHALELTQKRSGLLFGHNEVRMRSYDAANRALVRICKRTGVREIGWHTLRHTFATQLVARGAVIRAVQELMGHATVTMTERYAHVLPSSLRGAVALLSMKNEKAGQPVGNRWSEPQTSLELCMREIAP